MSREYRGDTWEGFDIEEEILDALKDLAQGVAVGGGSVKATNKKDRKGQRCTFKQLRVSRNYNIKPKIYVIQNIIGLHPRLRSTRTTPSTHYKAGNS